MRHSLVAARGANVSGFTELPDLARCGGPEQRVDGHPMHGLLSINGSAVNELVLLLGVHAHPSGGNAAATLQNEPPCCCCCFLLRELDALLRRTADVTCRPACRTHRLVIVVTEAVPAAVVQHCASRAVTCWSRSLEVRQPRVAKPRNSQISRGLRA
eukprot:4012323-Prymnesium_polylepis.2